MSAKLVIVILVVLAVVFATSVGAGFMREDKKGDPNNPPALGVFLNDALGWMNPPLDLADVSVSSGGDAVDLRKAERLLVVRSKQSSGARCTLRVRKVESDDPRIARVELVSKGVTVDIAAWEDDKPDDLEPKRMQVGEAVSLAFRGAGGVIEVTVKGQATCQIRFSE